jgi:hypothetical protein
MTDDKRLLEAIKNIDDMVYRANVEDLTLDWTVIKLHLKYERVQK